MSTDYGKRYYAANKEARLANYREWAASHKAERSAYMKQYVQDNAERIRQRERERRARKRTEVYVITPDVVARLDAGRDMSGGADACWPWMRTHGRAGYGFIKVQGRQLNAHRVAWEAANGPIPSGAMIRHSCDNPPCCNPAHLSPGTVSDNVADAVNRKRAYGGTRHHSNKLSEHDVRAMRERAGAGEILAALAREYGVSTAVVGDIVHKRKWRSLD